MIWLHRGAVVGGSAHSGSWTTRMCQLRRPMGATEITPSCTPHTAPKWTKDCIAAFSDDPGIVTLLG